MRILIDGDSCPVIGLAEELAREYKLQLLIFTDYDHNLESDYGQVVVVDQGFQAVDMALLNESKSGDIVVTGDYGLAAMVLANDCKALGFSGRVFNTSNIDTYLLKRHINHKIRQAGGRHATKSKRTSSEDEKFYINLRELIENNIREE